MADRVRDKRFRRVRTPSVLQMEATECGAASLGDHPGLSRTSRPARRAARRVPRLARRQQRPLRQEDRREVRALRQGVPDDDGAAPRAPAAIHGLLGTEPLSRRRGIGPRPGLFERPGERAAVGQPGRVHRVVRGHRLPVRAGAGLPRGGRSRATWRSIARRMAGAYTAVAFAVLAGVALMAAELVTATFNPLFVDQILVAERRQWIRPLLLAMGLTLLFRLLIGFLQLAGLRRLKQSLAATHSARFVWHVLRLPTVFYQQRYAGDIASRVDGNSAVADLVSGPLATTLVGLLMVVIYGAVMLAFDPVLAAVGRRVRLAQHGRHCGGTARAGRREHQGQTLQRSACRVDDARRPDHRDAQGGGVGARGPGPSDRQPGAVDERLAARHHGRRLAGRAPAVLVAGHHGGRARPGRRPRDRRADERRSAGGVPGALDPVQPAVRRPGRTGLERADASGRARPARRRRATPDRPGLRCCAAAPAAVHRARRARPAATRRGGSRAGSSSAT